MTPRDLSEAESRSVRNALKATSRAVAYLTSGEIMAAIGELRHAIASIRVAGTCKSEYDAAPTPDNVVQFKRANTP